MSYGIEIRNRFGTVVFSSDRPYGGVYVGTYSLSATVSSAVWRFDGSDPSFPNISGGNLRIIMVGAGFHAYDYSGSTLTLTRYASSSTAGTDVRTVLMVFST